MAVKYSAATCDREVSAPFAWFLTLMVCGIDHHTRADIVRAILDNYAQLILRVDFIFARK